MTAPTKNTAELARHLSRAFSTRQAPIPAPGEWEISSLVFRQNRLYLSLSLSREDAARLETDRHKAEKDLQKNSDFIAASAQYSGQSCTSVEAVHLSFATHREAPTASRPEQSSPAQEQTRPERLTGEIVGRPGGHRPFPTRARNSGPVLPDVRAVIAVASGKGGVGKSTLAVNLACVLARLGLATGLLDADIYGPSLPHMLGETARPEVKDGAMQPLEAWGLKTMSVGYLVDEKQPVIWRGPMVAGALTQLLSDVHWGALDVLIVDMPPGTGDTQLTLSQKLGDKMSGQGGAVIISTPQDIALIDARRGAEYFNRAGVRLLGLVENMSFFCCPHCHERTDLFSHGGARREAEALDIPFLGEIPLLYEIRKTADSGTPIVLAAPESAAGRTYQKIGEAVARSAGLITGQAGRPDSKIRAGTREDP